MSVKRWIRWISLSIFLITVSGLSFAQGVLTYGDTVQGTLSAQAPLSFHTFSGTEGDIITVYAIGTTPGLQPILTLLGAIQQQVAFADDDPYTPISGDASINYRLPQTATYTLLISSLNGAFGDYLIKLEGIPGETGNVVSQGQTVEAPAGATQVFVVDLNPATPTTFAFTPDPPDLQFTAQVVDNNGQLVGVFGSALLASGLTFPPGTGQYIVTLIFAESTATGTVQVASGTGTEQPVSDASTEPTAVPPEPVATEESAPPEPLATEEAVPVAGPPDGVCSVVTSGAVNVRSGPGTNYAIVGSLQIGVYYTVTGVHNDWYVIDYNGQTGWVANFVVEAFGPCAGLPFVESPSESAPVQAAPTYTAIPDTSSAPSAPVQATATVSSEQPVAVTATYTPSYTPTTQSVQATVTYTPSYTPTTPPAAQVAPEDARFNNPLDIPLDNTISVTDFVSYPGGDTEDRVRFSVTGMNNNVALSGGRARLTIAASCFGTGIENVQFFTGGQTFSCGQTLVDKSVTADSDTGSITITAVGGEGTYVQWVLTGTAVRE